jgi:hypothetical protein
LPLGRHTPRRRAARVAAPPPARRRRARCAPALRGRVEEDGWSPCWLQTPAARYAIGLPPPRRCAVQPPRIEEHAGMMAHARRVACPGTISWQWAGRTAPIRKRERPCCITTSMDLTGSSGHDAARPERGASAAGYGSPHPCAIHGSARPAAMRGSTRSAVDLDKDVVYLRQLHRERLVVKRLRRRGAHLPTGTACLVHGNRLGNWRVGTLPSEGRFVT